MSKKRIVIIGGTSSIAEHCARIWLADSSIELFLVGRNARKLEIVASDLRVRSPDSEVTCLEGDFINPINIQDTVNSILNSGPVDIVLIAHGSLADQEQCQDNLTLCNESLIVNGVSPVLFAEAFVKNMQILNKGTLAIIGSVAGDRGRKSNYIYGSAKGLVNRYAQGLQHRLANTDVQVVLIKPGPTDTPMTAQLKQQGKDLAKVEDVAKLIIDAISLGNSVVYTPRKWLFIMLIISNLPNFIFKRMNI